MTKHQLHELRERVQEDLLTLTDGYLIDELDGYEDYLIRVRWVQDFDTKMCEIIVNNFNRYEGQTT
jgi:hypothetical protein